MTAHRSPEARIAALEAQIERIKTRAERAKTRKDPALRHMRAAVRQIDKAASACGDRVVRGELQEARTRSNGSPRRREAMRMRSSRLRPQAAGSETLKLCLLRRNSMRPVLRPAGAEPRHRALHYRRRIRSRYAPARQPMPTNSPHLRVDQLRQFLLEACTTEQLRDALRDAKADDKRVHVSGAQAQLVDNLLAAHFDGIVSKDVLLTLLRDAEESGRHHSFFFRIPETAGIRFADPDWMERRASSSLEWDSKNGPLFTARPPEPTTCDIRIDKSANAPDAHVLVIKQYAMRSAESLTDENSYERDGLKYISRTSVIRSERVVSSARVHSTGILELRVPTELRDTRRQCVDDLARLQAAISKFIPESRYVPFSLKPAMERLVQGRTKQGVDYRIESARALDHGATAEFGAPMVGQDLFSSQSHEAAIAQYNEFERLDVYFSINDFRSGRDLTARFQMCPFVLHGLRVGARIDALDLQRLTLRLLRLAGQRRPA